jgi:hypothetical protein
MYDSGPALTRDVTPISLIPVTKGDGDPRAAVAVRGEEEPW